MEPSIGFLFKQIHDQFEKAINKKLKQNNLTLSQLAIVLFLFSKQNSKVNQKDIENHLQLKHPTVIGLLKRLEKKGIIQCETDPEDRRCKLVELTDKAEPIRLDMEKHRQEMDQMLLVNLSDQEIMTLKKLLNKIIENLSEI